MAKRLSTSKLESLKSRGATEVSSAPKKKVAKKKPAVDAVVKAAQSAAKDAEIAKARAEAVEKAVENQARMLERQLQQMQALIDKMPESAGGRIVGLEFIRGDNGLATGVRFIREGDKKRRLN